MMLQIRMIFNGREYILLDKGGRSLGWTRDEALAERVKEKIQGYDSYPEMPFKVQRWLALHHFGPS